MNIGPSILHTEHNLKKTTPLAPHTQENKGKTLGSMTNLLIGCMKILFLKHATIIFGLDK